MTLDENPLPASYEVRLQPTAARARRRRARATLRGRRVSRTSDTTVSG